MEGITVKGAEVEFDLDVPPLGTVRYIIGGKSAPRAYASSTGEGFLSRGRHYPGRVVIDTSGETWRPMPYHSHGYELKSSTGGTASTEVYRRVGGHLATALVGHLARNPLVGLRAEAAALRVQLGDAEGRVELEARLLAEAETAAEAIRANLASVESEISRSRGIAEIRRFLCVADEVPDEEVMRRWAAHSAVQESIDRY